MPKFSRAEIRAILGEACTDEIENKLVALHRSVTDPLKDELAEAKASADKLPDVQKELDKLKQDTANQTEYEKKYNEEHAKLEKLEAQVARDNDHRTKSGLYKKLLTSAGVSDKRHDTILKVTDLDKLSVKDGKLENEDKLLESIKSEWADFVVTSEEKHQDPETPPSGTGSKGVASRAAELQKLHNERLYGTVKKD